MNSQKTPANLSSYWLSLIAAVWIVSVVVVLAMAYRQGPVFDTSIITLLPKSDRQPVVQKAADEMAQGFSDQLVILLSGDDELLVRESVAVLADKLSKQKDVAKVTWNADKNDAALIHQQLFEYRYTLLSEQIRKQAVKENFNQLELAALFNLYNPISMFKASIIDDPFALFSNWILDQSASLNLQVSNGLLKVPEQKQPTYLLIFSLVGDAYSPALQQRVLSLLSQQEQQLAKQGIKLQKSGLLLHAAAGSEQAKSEMSVIGIGSLLGVTLLILLVFRQAKALALMMFPVFVGCSMATAITMLVFGKVHMITFAFGAGLVGVSIDYALHFMCQRQACSSTTILQKILPGLFLGLLSSVLAYGAQALTPFPGLRQMAVFSVVGLISSWLTVVLCFPYLTQKDSDKALKGMTVLSLLRERVPQIKQHLILKILLAVSVLLAVYSLLNSQSSDDIRLLQTSPASLLVEEKKVQTTLKVSSSSHFLLVKAGSIEENLQLEETISPLLDKLQKEGVLAGYQALSKVLPSLNRQDENAVLISELYNQKLLSFYNRLKVAEKNVQRSKQQLAEGIQRRLTPQVWAGLSQAQQYQGFIVREAGQTATVIKLLGSIDSNLQQQLRGLESQYPNLIYVDRVSDITELLSTYRQQMSYWVMLAYLAVLVILIARYKVQVWRVVFPPIVASLLTLAFIAQWEAGINLFHIMALILVLGIGLDMGIFLTETKESEHTWLAVSLSTITSLLAFGLLALSDTPVLHHFGLTVLVGLILVWLLTLTMRSENAIKKREV